MKPTPGTVTSRDGTVISFEKSGQGPAVILVAAALSDRSDGTKLARLLSDRFTVVNYDRRGRGASGDTLPYAVDREIEDIDALIGAAGAPAHLFGSSSGAALALDAANRLAAKVCKVVLFEPPFIVDSSHPPVAADFSARVDGLLEAGRRHDVVKLFMAEAIGVPRWAVFLMRWLMPGWSKMAAMAPSLLYDLAIMKGTQDGRPLPAARWRSASSPTLVLTGGKSEAFFHAGGRSLAALLPKAEHRVLPGLHHGSAVMAPKAFVEDVAAFFAA